MTVHIGKIEAYRCNLTLNVRGFHQVMHLPSMFNQWRAARASSIERLEEIAKWMIT
jgi:hypothetical protein